MPLRLSAATLEGISRQPTDPITEVDLRRAVARTFPPALREEALAKLNAWPFGRQNQDQPGFVALVSLRLCDGTLANLAERMTDVEGDLRDVLFGIQRTHGPDWVVPFLAE